VTGSAGGLRDVEPGDEFWEAAAAALAPDKSLTRIDEKAKNLIGGVSVVGAILGGAGLVASPRLLAKGPARGLAVGASLLAFSSVIMALTASLLRFEHSLAHRNLVAVREWYERQFRRAKLVVAAGVLLILAVALAATAVVVTLLAPNESDPTMQLTATRTGNETVVAARVEATDLNRGTLVTVDLASITSGQRSMLAQGVSATGSDSKATVSLEVRAALGVGQFELSAHTDRRQCVLRLGDSISESKARCVSG